MWVGLTVRDVLHLVADIDLPGIRVFLFEGFIEPDDVSVVDVLDIIEQMIQFQLRVLYLRTDKQATGTISLTYENTSRGYLELVCGEGGFGGLP